MKDRVKEAEKLFQDGYNCSQSVFSAFSDLYGIDRDTALRLSASFGGGFGRMREVCGAVSGMCMVAGLETGSSMRMDTEGKKHNYEVVRRLMEKYKDTNGSIICRELLGLDKAKQEGATPETRTSEYYKKRPCLELVKEAAQLTEQLLYDVEMLPVTKEEELQEVAVLAKAIWHEHYDSIIGSKQVDYMVEKFQSPQAMRDQIKQDGYRYYKLVNQGGRAGYFAYCSGLDGLFLSKIYVAAKFRGRGYSHRVIDFLEQSGREEKLDRIWLTVNRNNTSSIAAYERLGFHKVKTQIADIGSGYVMDDYIMEKSISSY